jgi:predicted  nucleic acid-binding Zn-ribbon protein
MENLSPKLIIYKLVLVGRHKSYSVRFHSGINIIHGDSDTGKSSILNLIDYLLGSSKIYMYDEIEQHGKYGLLEVSLNGKVFTIKRDIFSPNDYIEVYNSAIEKMNDVFPLEYSPNYSKEGPAGYYSDFLLSTLNIPIVKVKQSPSKENSEMVRLSFRDIFKYNYFDQDEVGSKEMLDRKSFALVVKNKETFKFLHNVLDTQITELQSQIGEKNKEKLKLENNFKIISSFLLETKLSTEETLREKKSEIEKNLVLLEDEIKKISKKMKSDNEEIEQMRDIVISLDLELNDLYKEKAYKENQLDQNIRLRKEYDGDISKLQTSLKVKERITPHNINKVECPLCNNHLKFENVTEFFTENNEEVIKKELNSLKNRYKDLKLFIEETRNKIFNIEQKIVEKNEDLERARKALDNSSEKFVSPYISQRDLLVSEKTSLIEKLDKLQYFLKIRNQLSEITNNIELLKTQVEELNKKLEKLESLSPSIESILSDIGTYLKEFLEFIPIRNPFGIRISGKTYIPVVRERDYTDLTSGGLRTLVSIGYLISILKNSLYTITNYPSLIMIDTIGKYLGKTQKEDIEKTDKEEDKKEGFNDPSKYLNIYNYLNTLSEDLLENKKDHQIIIVDNDFPLELEKKYNKYVVKRFSVDEREGYEIGFIDNAKSRSF